MADKSQIHDFSAFEEREIPEFKYPLFLDKKLSHLWGGKIDLTGWSAFKRLVIV